MCIHCAETVTLAVAASSPALLVLLRSIINRLRTRR